MTSRNVKNTLLIGLPGCGKTTLVQRVVERLPDRRVAGFYTSEIRRGGRRLGFEAIGMGGTCTVLSHVEFKSPMRVGRYGVKLDGFETLLSEELGRSPEDVDLYVVDEIGKMECFSKVFVEAVTRVLDGPIPVMATIALKGGGFIESVKSRPDVELLTVSADNRVELVDELARCFARQRRESPG